jgi:hypothetical protein
LREDVAWGLRHEPGGSALSNVHRCEPFAKLSGPCFSGLARLSAAIIDGEVVASDAAGSPI